MSLVKNEEYTQALLGAMKGDRESTERLIKLIIPRVLYIAQTVAKNHHDGEDAAQESVIRIIYCIKNLKNPENFDSWMYRITVNTTINLCKKKKEYVSIEEVENSLKVEKREFLPQAYAEDKEKRDLLMDIIKKLSQRQRACLLLFYFSNLGYQEIAETLNITKTDVANTLNRSKKKIKKMLEKKEGSSLEKIGAYSITPVPVLASVFEQAISESVSYEAAECIFTSVISGIGSATGTLTAVSGVGRMALSSFTKAYIGLAASTIVVASGFVFRNDVPDETECIPVTVIETQANADLDGQISALETETEEISELETEGEINTLEDLIGEDKASRFKEFVSDGVDEADWIRFIEEIEAEEKQVILTYTEEYATYQLKRQDKQLIIIVQKCEDARLTVVYRFGDNSEEIPINMDIYFAFEEWREDHNS